MIPRSRCETPAGNRELQKYNIISLIFSGARGPSISPIVTLSSHSSARAGARELEPAGPEDVDSRHLLECLRAVTRLT